MSSKPPSTSRTTSDFQVLASVHQYANSPDFANDAARYFSQCEAQCKCKHSSTCFNKHSPLYLYRLTQECAIRRTNYLEALRFIFTKKCNTLRLHVIPRYQWFERFMRECAPIIDFKLLRACIEHDRLDTFYEDFNAF